MKPEAGNILMITKGQISAWYS